MSDSGDSVSIEQRKIQLEESKFRYEVMKWAIVALATVVSFYVIDLGKLRLEEFRVRAENQRALLQSYLTATEAVQPDVWKRKLRVLQTFSEDSSIREWAKGELVYIDNFAAKDALYRETLKVASQLVNPGTVKDPQREAIRARYEQLYWADLPFAKESEAVKNAMVTFRDALQAAEESVKNAQAWFELDNAMIDLSKALRDSQPGGAK